MAAAKKILIVDDDSDDRELFCEALYEVMPDADCYQAPNGRRALLALDNGEIALPDLIFLDLNMPQMNGWQALVSLKENKNYQAVPVIVYSTSSYEEDIEKARRLGALCFFSKPSDFKGLKKSLRLVAEHLLAGSLTALGQRSLLC